MWNAEVELDVRLTPRNSERLAEEWLPALADFHPVVGSSRTGHALIVMTLPAESIRQACVMALAVVQDVTGRAATSVRVLTTEAFDADVAEEPDVIPRLLSVPDAAAQLGQSRQAVLQAVEQGRYPAVKVGNSWGVLASAIEARVAQAGA